MKALLAVAVVAATLLAATADQTCQKEEASCKDSGAKCVADFVYSAANCTNNTACCKYPLLCVNGVCRTNFENEGCKVDADCKGSVYDTQVFACIGGKCVMQGNFGDSCLNDTHCAGGMACVQKRCEGLNKSKACTEPYAVGPDMTNFQCGKGLACHNGKCDEAVKVGSPCHDDSNCDVYSVCNAGKCTERWSLGKNDECTHSLACGPGLYCYMPESSCRPTIPARRIECTEDKQCANYSKMSTCSVCDPATGKMICSDPIGVEVDCIKEMAAAYKCYRSKGCAPKPSSSLDTCAQQQCTAETDAVFACKSRCDDYKSAHGKQCVDDTLLRYCPLIPTWLRITIAFSILIVIILVVFIVYGIVNCIRKSRAKYVPINP